MSQEMLATRNREPRTMAAIWTFSITVREMACHCLGERCSKKSWEGLGSGVMGYPEEKTPEVSPKLFRQG